MNYKCNNINGKGIHGENYFMISVNNYFNALKLKKN